MINDNLAIELSGKLHQLEQRLIQLYFKSKSSQELTQIPLVKAMIRIQNYLKNNPQMTREDIINYFTQQKEQYLRTGLKRSLLISWLSEGISGLMADAGAQQESGRYFEITERNKCAAIRVG